MARPTQLLAQLGILGRRDPHRPFKLLTHFLKNDPTQPGYLFLTEWVSLAQQQREQGAVSVSPYSTITAEKPANFHDDENGPRRTRQAFAARAAFERALQFAADYLPVIEQLIVLDFGQHLKYPKAPMPWCNSKSIKIQRPLNLGASKPKSMQPKPT